MMILTAGIALGLASSGTLAADDAERIGRENHFEKRVRPLLVAHCVECHSTSTQADGGLLLDSEPGWRKGGDLGPVIVPGDALSSRLIEAVRYTNDDLQMPPDGRLSDAEIDALETWINDGAYDPRRSPPASADPRGDGPVKAGQTETDRPARGLSIDDAQSHWAYRPLGTGDLDHGNAIDTLIDRKLEAAGLAGAPQATARALVRRLTYDLHGLPPTPDQIQRFVDDSAPDAYERLVDRLLASPRFGERFARHWMDVARYAESITLRGLVLDQAWRYRDYLVRAYNADRPWDQIIREQVAGDLMQADNLAQRHDQLIATAFLAMGNHNLEDQDKHKLDLDAIDERLETMSLAFMGQTIGCARCHDHKFDPIPSSDYYALAGIFQSVQGFKHENVSRWIDKALPLNDAQQTMADQDTQRLELLQRRARQLQTQLKRVRKSETKSVPVDSCKGIVVDTGDAKLVGSWVSSTFIGRYVGDGYAHDAGEGKGERTATFEAMDLPPGRYEVRMSFTASPSRASNVPVTVFSADGEHTVIVNQQQSPPDEGLWLSLGTYRFEKDGQAYVLISNSGTQGYVIVDAIEFLSPDAKSDAKPDGESVASQDEQEKGERLASELRELNQSIKEHQQRLDAVPRYLTINQTYPATNMAIRLRGNPHQLGDEVPRGFLRAFRCGQDSATISQDPSTSGRLELARWLTHPEHPLTARVYANRIWLWLMGEAIVRTPNNFGTTAPPPSHPELLDHLARQLIRNAWSTKHLVRSIVMTDVYRRSTRADHSIAKLAQRVDPENHLLWRANVRRLDVESMRDAMLAISGEIDLQMGGCLIPEGTSTDYDFRHRSTRRSVYHPVLRNTLPELYDVFDFADPSVSVGKRSQSIVAPQALALMHHRWVIERASRAAAALKNQDDQQAIPWLFEASLGREPEPAELRAALEFLDSGGQRASLIQSLWSSIDFRYLE